MANMKNYTEMKNATAIKAQVRQDIMEVVTAALREYYGDENVKQVGSNEYATVVGYVKDADGFEQDVCATVKPTVKEWETRRATKKTFEKYDIEEEAAAYKMSIAEKAEAKAEKERLKAEKIERDKKVREEKKKAEAEKKAVETE